jgi:hypothetical protein
MLYTGVLIFSLLVVAGGVVTVMTTPHARCPLGLFFALHYLPTSIPHFVSFEMRTIDAL